MKGLVILPGESGAVEEFDDLRGPDALIGGWLEGISPSGPGARTGWHAYCDEEGKLKGLKFNVAATSLAIALGWPSGGDVLCGPVVFLGDGDPDEGGDADVPEFVLMLHRLMAEEYDG